MKKSITLLLSLYLLAGCQLSPFCKVQERQEILVASINPYIAGIVSGCATSSTGDITNENFPSSGSSDLTWTSGGSQSPTIGASNPDTVSPMCDYGMYVNRTNTGWQRVDLGSTYNDVIIKFRIRFVSDTAFTSGYTMQMIFGNDTNPGTSNAGTIYLEYRTGNSNFSFYEGGDNYSTVNVSTGTWYTIELVVSTTSGGSISVDSETPVGNITSSDGVRYIFIGGTDTGKTSQVYVDVIEVSDNT